MTHDKRRKDANWSVNLDGNGSATSDVAQLAVLMDIRDELKQLNRVFACGSFQAIPRLILDIRRNTTKKRKRKN